MLFIPMDGPESTPCIVRCAGCTSREQSSNMHADIKGEPFKAFYCHDCVRDFMRKGKAIVMSREEFFARIENAHV